MWYGTLGIARDDKAGRDDIVQQNIVSYNAPVLLLCYTERSFTEPQWADLGMWLQTVMLLLREEGLDSCAQQFMTFYSRLIKQEIGISDDEFILYTGLAIEHRDPDKPVNNFERPRAPLDEQVRFLGFE